MEYMRRALLILGQNSKTCAMLCSEGSLLPHLAKIGAQEQAASGVLDTLAHLHQVLEDVLRMRLLGSYEA